MADVGQRIAVEQQKDHPALRFYDRGKLLGEFSTADLVKDKSKVRPSASHYQWLFDPKDLEDDLPPHPPGPCFDGESVFSLTTIDVISYAFDAARAEIKESKHQSLPPWHSEPD